MVAGQEGELSTEPQHQAEGRADPSEDKVIMSGMSLCCTFCSSTSVFQMAREAVSLTQKSFWGNFFRFSAAPVMMSLFLPE